MSVKVVLSPVHSLSQEASGHPLHTPVARGGAHGHPLHKLVVRGHKFGFSSTSGDGRFLMSSSSFNLDCYRSPCLGTGILGLGAS